MKTSGPVPPRLSENSSREFFDLPSGVVEQKTFLKGRGVSPVLRT